MALDVDKLFKTLEKGFDGMEKGMTDKTLRMEMRMDKMRQRMEDSADKIRRKAEKMGQTKSRIIIDGKDLSDIDKHPAVQMFKIFIGSLKWFLMMALVFYIFITFNRFMDHVDNPKSPPPLEQKKEVETKESKKI